MYFIIYLFTCISTCNLHVSTCMLHFVTYTIIAAFVGVGRKKYPSSTPSFNTFKYDSNFFIDM